MKTCVVSPRVLQEVGLIADLEVVRAALTDAVLAAQHALDVRHRVRDLVLRCGEHADRPQAIGADHAKARRLDRDEHLVVRIAERCRLTLRLEHADDGELDPANADVSPTIASGLSTPRFVATVGPEDGDALAPLVLGAREHAARPGARTFAPRGSSASCR